MFLLKTFLRLRIVHQQKIKQQHSYEQFSFIIFQETSGHIKYPFVIIDLVFTLNIVIFSSFSSQPVNGGVMSGNNFTFDCAQWRQWTLLHRGHTAECQANWKCYTLTWNNFLRKYLLPITFNHISARLSPDLQL